MIGQTGRISEVAPAVLAVQETHPCAAVRLFRLGSLGMAEQCQGLWESVVVTGAVVVVALVGNNGDWSSGEVAVGLGHAFSPARPARRTGLDWGERDIAALKVSISWVCLYCL